MGVWLLTATGRRQSLGKLKTQPPPFSDPSVVLIHSSRLNHSLRAIFFLVTAIPPKVEEAFKLFQYIPYSSLLSHPTLRCHVAKK